MPKLVKPAMLDYLSNLDSKTLVSLLKESGNDQNMDITLSTFTGMSYSLARLYVFLYRVDTDPKSNYTGVAVEFNAETDDISASLI